MSKIRMKYKQLSSAVGLGKQMLHFGVEEKNYLAAMQPTTKSGGLVHRSPRMSFLRCPCITYGRAGLHHHEICHKMTVDSSFGS